MYVYFLIPHFSPFSFPLDKNRFVGHALICRVWNPLFRCCSPKIFRENAMKNIKNNYDNKNDKHRCLITAATTTTYYFRACTRELIATLYAVAILLLSPRCGVREYSHSVIWSVFLARVVVSRINFYCRAAAIAAAAEGRDWPNGIGEPDRRRLADTRTMPSRAPHGRASVFFGVVRVLLRRRRRPSASSSSL